MHAAAHAFADKGFHATTTRDIASGAGLSPAGVYVHFGSKEELLFNLSRSGHESALRLLRGAIADGPTPTDQLANVMARFSEWHVEQYQVARVVQYEHHHLTPEHHAEVLALRKEMDGLVRGVLDRGVADGAFTVDDSADTALALLSIVVDVARWYSPTIRRSPEQIGATNAALALRLVGASH
jgi:AcrR family transcriptional regulator